VQNLGNGTESPKFREETSDGGAPNEISRIRPALGVLVARRPRPATMSIRMTSSDETSGHAAELETAACQAVSVFVESKQRAAHSGPCRKDLGLNEAMSWVRVGVQLHRRNFLFHGRYRAFCHNAEALLMPPASGSGTLSLAVSTPVASLEPSCPAGHASSRVSANERTEGRKNPVSHFEPPSRLQATAPGTMAPRHCAEDWRQRRRFRASAKRARQPN
jgi:hypothetical protein